MIVPNKLPNIFITKPSIGNTQGQPRDTTAVDNQIKQLFSVTGEAGIVQQQMLEAYQKLKQ